VNPQPSGVQQRQPEPVLQRRGEPAGMVRRTYYYSEHVADALADAVARIHHNSHGRVSKAAALDAIITAGLEQVDAIEQRLRSQASEA
jgi:hypothetical protein